MAAVLSLFGGWTVVALSALTGLSLFFLIRGFAVDEEALKVHMRLANERGVSKELENYIRLSIVAGFIFGGLVKRLKWVTPEFEEKKKNFLMRAGMRDADIVRFCATKLFLTLLTPIGLVAMLLILSIVSPGLRSYWWIVALIGVPLGFAILDFWFGGVIKRRVKAIVREFPFMLDMISLSVGAGMEFTAAMRRYNETNPPSELTSEVDQMLHEVQIGASRQEALRSFQQRVQHADILSFTITLVQAIRLGANIADALLELSAKMRGERFNRAERAGAAAAQKMLVPLMICILPAVIVIIMGVAYFAMRQNPAM